MLPGTIANPTTLHAIFVTLSAFVVQFYPRFSMLAGMLYGLSSNGSVCDVKFVHYTIYIWKLSNLSDAFSYRTILHGLSGVFAIQVCWVHIRQVTSKK